jgi:diguanylate cyclase
MPPRRLTGARTDQNAMRYLESKQHSAQLLRLALPLMVRQNAAYHPVSYTLWYEHVAGLNPSLSAALAARLEESDALSEEDAYRLYARHISERDAAVLETLQRRLQALLESTAQEVATACEDSGRFRRSLQQGRSDLTNEVSASAVQEVIGRLLSEALRMEAATQTLTEKLDARTRDVLSLTKQLNEAHTEALTDPLCALSNRRGFMRAAQELCDSEQGLEGAALVLIDADHFKWVNDTFGHLLGDKVLRAIAEVLRANIKGRDIAARIGGEEFALLLPQTPLQGAHSVAEQIRLAVQRIRIHGDRAHDTVGSVTISLGLALGRAGESIDELMARADVALYAAKRDGRNRVGVS